MYAHTYTVHYVPSHVQYMFTHVHLCRLELIGRCVELTEADLTVAVNGDDRTEEITGRLSRWISTSYNTTMFGRNIYCHCCI